MLGIQGRFWLFVEVPPSMQGLVVYTVAQIKEELLDQGLLGFSRVTKFLVPKEFLDTLEGDEVAAPSVPQEFSHRITQEVAAHEEVLSDGVGEVVVVLNYQIDIGIISPKKNKITHCVYRQNLQQKCYFFAKKTRSHIVCIISIYEKKMIIQM